MTAYPHHRFAHLPRYFFALAKLAVESHPNIFLTTHDTHDSTALPQFRIAAIPVVHFAIDPHACHTHTSTEFNSGLIHHFAIPGLSTLFCIHLPSPPFFAISRPDASQRGFSDFHFDLILLAALAGSIPFGHLYSSMIFPIC